MFLCLSQGLSFPPDRFCQSGGAFFSMRGKWGREKRGRGKEKGQSANCGGIFKLIHMKFKKRNGSEKSTPHPGFCASHSLFVLAPGAFGQY